MSASHYINGQWIPGQGPALTATNPTTGEPAWQGRAATAPEVDDALAAARNASIDWARRDEQTRSEALDAFARQLEKHADALAHAISIDTGKPLWESRTEVQAMIGKIAITREARQQRQPPVQRDLGSARGVTRYKPHGVLAVFGPFNFPGHVPNGHIVPALLAGNTIVFKPSEQTPLVAERTLACWDAAGLPPGVINLLQGARDTGIALAEHPNHDGILFTGSLPTGLALRRALVERPDKILALELGGNNPLVVHDAADLQAAAYHTIQSAYITAGQRCTCARRLIVPEGSQGDAFVQALIEMIARVRVGPYTDEPEPFAGPVISLAAAERLLEQQRHLRQLGGEPLVAMSQHELHPAILSPGLIDVTPIAAREDREVFGPLLQLIRVRDFDAAVREANDTAFGLVAGLLSDDAGLYERFYEQARAGLINWNRPSTGASSYLPFGGVGLSGNHRPSGYTAIDYCAYPVGSLEAERLALPEKPVPGIPGVARA